MYITESIFLSKNCLLIMFYSAWSLTYVPVKPGTETVILCNNFPRISDIQILLAKSSRNLDQFHEICLPYNRCNSCTKRSWVWFPATKATHSTLLGKLFTTCRNLCYEV